MATTCPTPNPAIDADLKCVAAPCQLPLRWTGHTRVDRATASDIARIEELLGPGVRLSASPYSNLANTAWWQTAVEIEPNATFSQYKCADGLVATGAGDTSRTCDPDGTGTFLGSPLVCEAPPAAPAPCSASLESQSRCTANSPFQHRQSEFGKCIVVVTPGGASEVLRQIRAGEKSCAQVVDAYLARIDAVNGTVHACVEVCHDSARAAAAAVDEKIKAAGSAEEANLGALEGLPIIVKTNVDVAGTLTTNATAALADWRPKKSAPCAERLLGAGAIVLGKTVMPEAAMRFDSWNTVHPIARNPHCVNYSTGGSSSGTGVGVASGMAPCGVGSDTSGSLRLPAMYNGIVGFRPSLGRWPGEGVVPISKAYDTAGPMGSCVGDIALMDAVVNGEEPAAKATAEECGKTTILVPDDWVDGAAEHPWGKTPVAPAYRAALDAAVEALGKTGCTVKRDGATGIQEKVLKL
eukprot:g1486.t1